MQFVVHYCVSLSCRRHVLLSPPAPSPSLPPFLPLPPSLSFPPHGPISCLPHPSTPPPSLSSSQSPVFSPSSFPPQRILQPYVNDLFHAIFAVPRGRPLPKAIKSLFDFLDLQAAELGIQDHEILHTWKTNRFGQPDSQDLCLFHILPCHLLLFFVYSSFINCHFVVLLLCELFHRGYIN